MRLLAVVVISGRVDPCIRLLVATVWLVMEWVIAGTEEVPEKKI